MKCRSSCPISCSLWQAKPLPHTPLVDTLTHVSWIFKTSVRCVPPPFSLIFLETSYWHLPCPTQMVTATVKTPSPPQVPSMAPPLHGKDHISSSLLKSPSLDGKLPPHKDYLIPLSLQHQTPCQAHGKNPMLKCGINRSQK